MLTELFGIDPDEYDETEAGREAEREDIKDHLGALRRLMIERRGNAKHTK